MRLIPFLCLVVFAMQAIPLAAQQPLIDSLHNSLRTAKPNSTEEANLNLQIGLEYYRTSNSENAMEYLGKARQIATAINDTLAWARALNGIGRLRSDKSEYPLALAEYQQALRLTSKINDLQLTAHIQKNIGVLYISWKDFTKALAHYDEAQKIAFELGDNRLIADCYNNKATAYEQLKEYDQALDYYQQALNYYEKENLRSGMAMCYANMAIVFKEQQAYQKAIDYNIQALAIIRLLGEKWMEAATLNNIGSVYYSMGQYSQTINYCEASLQLAGAISAPEIEVAALETLADAAAARKDYPLAYQYMVRFHKANDQFINAEKTRQFAELEVKYKTEVKEEQIELLRAQDENNLLIIQKQRWTLISVILFVVIVFALLLALFIQFKKRQKNKKAQELLRLKELERARIARDMHDDIGAGLTRIVMRSEQVKLHLQASRAAHNGVMENLDKLSSESRELTHSIGEIIWALNPQNDTLCELFAYIRNYIYDFLDDAGISCQIHFPNEISNISVLPELRRNVFLIVKESLNNIVKYACADLVEVRLQFGANRFSLTIEDNGKGIDVENELPVGNGLANMKKRTEEIGGVFLFKSQPGRGTLVAIENILLEEHH